MFGRSISKVRVCVWVAVVLLAAALAGQVIATKLPAKKENHTATELRLASSGWWPTKGSDPRDEYVDSAACARCHSDKANTFKNTPMAHALAPVGPGTLSEVSAGPVRFQIGAYRFELAQNSNGAVYSASNGMQSVSVPVGWVVGNGEFGRTYLYLENGAFYESRLSYYRSVKALDFTTGSPRVEPNRLGSALGRHIMADDVPLCFGCHSTASTSDNHFDPTHLIAGVTCEACHGPGARHVAAMSLPHDARSSSFIFNPARLDPVASVDFCGACHRTSVDVALSGVTGILSLRFPAYRLERSRCKGVEGASLTCVACHDPHEPLAHVPESYDKNCLNCHGSESTLRGVPSQNDAHQATEANSARNSVCPVGQKACVGCHMPKYNIPNMHTTFTDHKIATRRQGDSFVE